MSVTGYENQLIESIKRLKEEGREAQKLVRELTKKRRKERHLPDYEEEMLNIYNEEIYNISKEINSLQEELASINYKEDRYEE